MAVIQPTVTDPQGDGSTKLVKWAALANTDTGAPFMMPAFSQMSMQVTGTIGTGGKVQLKGSQTGTTYAQLPNKQGTAIELSALGFAQSDCGAAYVRPEITAGDGTTALTVEILFTRVTPLRT